MHIEHAERVADHEDADGNHEQGTRHRAEREEGTEPAEQCAKQGVGDKFCNEEEKDGERRICARRGGNFATTAGLFAKHGPVRLCDTPGAQEYMSKHTLPKDDHPLNDAWQVYIMHVFRMQEICRKYGKFTIAWDGFAADRRRNAANVDINSDGLIDFADIDPFVEILSSQSGPCPGPRTG
jgi:hypothetical protein